MYDGQTRFNDIPLLYDSDLTRAGISTFAELEAMTNTEIANIRGLGLRGYREILEKLGRQTDDRTGSKEDTV